MTSFNFDFLDRQKQIIRQHIGTLSDQDCQKLKQMSSAEMRQYFSQRNLLITNTKGKFYFDKKR